MASTKNTSTIFAPPPGPPPPVLSDGWAAKFDERYQQFYYVNLATKQAQWERPLSAVAVPTEARVSSGGQNPPSYQDSTITGRVEPGPHSEDRGNETQPLISSAQSDYHTTTICEGDQCNNRSAHSRVFPQKPESPNTCPYQQKRLLQPYHYGLQESGYYQQPGYLQNSSSRYMQPVVLPPRPGVGAGTSAALGAGAGLLGGLVLGEMLEDHGGYERGLEDGVELSGGDNDEGQVEDFDDEE